MTPHPSSRIRATVPPMTEVDTDPAGSLGDFRRVEPQPGSTNVVDGVVHFTWPRPRSDSAVFLVPGWGYHPFYYARLIERLREHATIISVWSEPSVDGRASALHYRRLSQTLARVRANYPHSSFSIVGESLGCTYLLAGSMLQPTDDVVLIAPGLIPRARQLASPPALADSWRLVAHDAMPILNWRFLASSDNQAFIADVRRSGLTPPFTGRGYVMSAAAAAFKAPFKHHKIRSVLVLQGADDQLLNPLGATVAFRSLRAKRKELKVIAGAGHGLIWDTSHGPATIDHIVEFLFGERPTE
jgi:alpha-beta hydrolase superfamily lysophospholipase